VLLVEADAALRESTAALLTGGGCPVTAVASAEAALVELQARPFAVLLTDARLPGNDGLWLIQQADRQQLLGSTKVVVVTSDRHLSCERAWTVLLRPVSARDLLQVVRRAAGCSF
jgi:CheY-like chemotaxis protein